MLCVVKKIDMHLDMYVSVVGVCFFVTQLDFKCMHVRVHARMHVIKTIYASSLFFLPFIIIFSPFFFFFFLILVLFNFNIHVFYCIGNMLVCVFLIFVMISHGWLKEALV